MDDNNMTEENKEKGYVEENIEEPERFRYNYSMRGFLLKIFIPFFISFDAIYIMSLIMKLTKFKLGYLCSFNLFSPLLIAIGIVYAVIAYKISMKNIKVFLSLMFALLIAVVAGYVFRTLPINILYVKVFLGSVIVSSFLTGLYYILFVKTGYIIVDARAIEINDGVLSRQKDSTDLTEIKDKDIKRSPIDMLIGTSKIELELTRVKQRVVLKFLNYTDANELYLFIRDKSYSSSREYWINLDKKKSSNTQSGKRVDRTGQYVDILSDGDGKED